MLLDAQGNRIDNGEPKDFRAAIVLVRPREALEYSNVPLLQTIVRHYEDAFRRVHLASGFDSSIEAEFLVLQETAPATEHALFTALLQAHFKIADLLLGQGKGKAPLSAVRDGTMDQKVLDTLSKVTGFTADELRDELVSRKAFVQKKIDKGVN